MTSKVFYLQMSNENEKLWFQIQPDQWHSAEVFAQLLQLKSHAIYFLN